MERELKKEYQDMLFQDFCNLNGFCKTYHLTWLFQCAPFVLGEEISETEAKKLDEETAKLDKEMAKMPEEVRKKLAFKSRRPSTRKEHQLLEDRFLTKEKDGIDKRAYVKHYLYDLDEISRSIGETVQQIQRGLDLGIDEMDSPLTNVLLSMSMAGYALSRHAQRMSGKNPDKDLQHAVTEYGHAGACCRGLAHVFRLYNVFALEIYQFKKCIPFERDQSSESQEPKDKPKRYYSLRECQGIKPFLGILPWRVAYDEDSLIPPSYHYLLPPELQEMLNEFNEKWKEIYCGGNSRILRTDSNEWGRKKDRKQVKRSARG